MDYKNKCKDYIRGFEAKNLPAISEMFADTVTLRDWVIGTIQGKSAVIAENKKIFDSCKTIKISIEGMHGDQDIVVCEIAIRFDDKNPLLVTDVIGFNQGGQIQFVRAYKGN